MAESRTGTRRGLESSPPLVTAEGIKPLPPTGARKVDLPYDNEARSMLQTPSASPGPAASATHPGRRGERRRSTTIHLGPEKPEGVAEGNWIQTVPGKGRFIILRLYSPLASFFDILS